LKSADASGLTHNLTALLARVEAIAALRERIQSAAVQVAWIPALQKDTRARNAHSSTAIEGNPLTLEQVRAVEAGEALAVPARVRREVVNYFAALRHIEKQAARKRLAHGDVLRLHGIIAGEVMDQGEAGRYRSMRVRVGTYVPPPPEEVKKPSKSLHRMLAERGNPSTENFFGIVQALQRKTRMKLRVSTRGP